MNMQDRTRCNDAMRIVGRSVTPAAEQAKGVIVAALESGACGHGELEERCRAVELQPVACLTAILQLFMEGRIHSKVDGCELTFHLGPRPEMGRVRVRGLRERGLDVGDVDVGA